MNRVAMCQVRSMGKTIAKQKKKKKKVQWSGTKKKRTVINPIWPRMKKRSPSNEQNGQLVHWWLLVHFGRGYRGL